MRVAAIVTRDPERRAKAARDYPLARVVNTVDDLWSLARMPLFGAALLARIANPGEQLGTALEATPASWRR